MLEFNASRHLHVLSVLAIAQAGVEAMVQIGNAGAPGGKFLIPVDFVANLDAVEADLRAMGLPASLASFRRLGRNLMAVPVDLTQMPSSIRAFDQVYRDELEGRKFLSLSIAESDLYAPAEPHFGPIVRSKFSHAIYEIDEAAKCLALGRATACVFHLMRVVEQALRAIHRCLNLPIPDSPSWGIWLKQIREERVKRGDRKWPENDYFQDVYSRLDAIKDAQRDSTMHVETIHTEEEARLIFENTGAFMKKIASRMDESGEPKA
jgi:hypothetical protein